MKNLLLFLFITFTCYSCCQKEYDELSKDELSWLPYEVGDTLYFKSNLGNMDKWVVTEKEYNELSYGEGHTRCAMVYYKGFFFTLQSIKDSLNYEFALMRYSRTRNTSLTFGEKNGTGYLFDVSKMDTLSIDAGFYLESISGINTYYFEKGIGLNKYILRDSTEIYEKL